MNVALLKFKTATHRNGILRRISHKLVLYVRQNLALDVVSSRTLSFIEAIGDFVLAEHGDCSSIEDFWGHVMTGGVGNTRRGGSALKLNERALTDVPRQGALHKTII